MGLRPLNRGFLRPKFLDPVKVTFFGRLLPLKFESDLEMVLSLVPHSSSIFFEVCYFLKSPRPILVLIAIIYKDYVVDIILVVII